MANIEKIYDITIKGGEKSVGEVEKLNAAFDKLRETKKELNEALGSALLSKGSTEEVANLRKQLTDLGKQMAAVGRERQKATNDAKSAAQAEKLLAEVKLKEAQAAAALAKAEKERTASIIAQEKELDRQIDREARLTAQMDRQAKKTQEATGYYNRLKAELDSLYKLVKGAEKTDFIQFQGTNLNYDEAIGKLKELSAAEQDFRRQFAKDQTLVGEYTTGILQAFDKAGLNDLINNQINNATDQISKLDKTFEELTKEYQKIKQEGTGAFEQVEKEMIENRKEAEKLRNEVAGINSRLKEVGGIGDKVTQGLKDGFRNAAKEITTYAVGLFGLQKLLSVVSSEYEKGLGDAKQIEAVEAAFQRLNDPGLLDSLRQATKGTVSDLELMKAAVNAKNFNIPLDQFATFLEFARRRAQETGQEVGFLVNSIVTGIGRKSPQILDNLQISATRIKEAFAGVNAETLSTPEYVKRFSALVNAELEDMGTEIDTNSQKISQQQAEWTNMRTEFARKLLPVISAVGSALFFLVNNLALAIPLFITTIGLTNTLAGAALRWVAAMALEKTALVIERAQLIANNAVKATATALNNIYTASIIRSTTATGAAAIAYRLLAAAIAFLTSPIGIVIGLITALTTVVGVLSANAAKASKSIDSLKASQEKLAAQQRLNEAIAKKVAETTGSQIARIEQLTKAVANQSFSEATRKKAMDELIRISPTYREALEKEGDQIDNVRKASDALIESLKKQAEARAVAELAFQKQQRKTELELQLSALPDIDIKNEKGAGAFIKNLAAGFGLGAGTVGQQRRNLINEITGLDSELGVLWERIGTNSETQKKIFEDNTNDTTKDLSKLTNSQKEAIKDIEANYARQVAIEKARVATIKQLRELTAIEESEHFKTLTSLETGYLDQKLSLLSGNNAEERKLQAEFNLQKIESELNLQKDLSDIREKEFNRINSILRKEFDSFEANEGLKLETIEGDFFTDDLTKASAKLNFLETLLQAQKEFNQNQDNLEKQLSINSELNTIERAKAITDIEKRLVEARMNFMKVSIQQSIKNAESQASVAISRLQQDIAARTIDILENDNLSEFQKGKKLQELERDGKQQLLQAEVDGLKNIVEAKRVLYEKDKGYAQDYYGALADLSTKSAELEKLKAEERVSIYQRLKEAFSTSFIAQLLGLREFESAQDKINAAFEQTADIINNTINQAFQGWLQTQKQVIDNQLKASIELIDKEKERALTTAQSAEERATIEKKYEAQREQAERVAGEKKKRLALKEAAINYGVAVMKTMMQYGFPLGLIPVAGLTVQYLLQRGQINAQQFADGGQVQPASLGEGKISAPSNIAMQPNGDNVLATVRTGEVILNESQQKALGGASTFRAIGVPGFAGGGLVQGEKFNGLMTGGTPAPIVSTDSDGRLSFGIQPTMSDLKDLVMEQSAQINSLNVRTNQVVTAVERISKIPVVAQEVQAVNGSREAASSYGTF
jgi:predicted DNA-binding WGR domain protein